ncbi:hypothetical protein QOL99_04525 [Deinococcus sp. MIMF12]|uniref:CHAD domain-containing protein n=1 Tax=Deinococcus rhizophilus TaxID=3049544 RepID=A0ABT7JIC8_9DEIO|nr:hypothetical protein [Deinococcus rhizophilus]MDL2343414.1 hypothetical protein [Deinococcus rhizophilus]
MIRDLAITLERRAEFVHALKDETETVEQLTTRKTRLRDAVKALNAGLQTWHLLVQAGIVQSEQPRSLPGTLKQLDKVRNLARQNHLSLLDNDVHVALKNLKNLTDEVALDGQRLWQEHLDALKPPVPDALLDVLERHPEWTGRIRQWRTLNKEHARMRAPQPVTPTLIAQAQTLAEQYASLRRAMVELDLPAAVLEFFECTGDGRATLADLTPDILEWLRLHKLLSAFSVRLRPSL